VIFSPGVMPEMEATIAVSSEVRPVTFTERIVYSLGTLAFLSASNSGSTEVTLESTTWAKEVKLRKQKAGASAIDNIRRMLMDSVNKAIGKRSLRGKLTVNFKPIC
jgi:hypothetical protein